MYFSIDVIKSEEATAVRSVYLSVLGPYWGRILYKGNAFS